MDLDKTATQMVYVRFYSKYIPIKHIKSLDKYMVRAGKSKNIEKKKKSAAEKSSIF